MQCGRLTTLVPNVSVLANRRGNTGKSTARMAIALQKTQECGWGRSAYLRCSAVAGAHSTHVQIIMPLRKLLMKHFLPSCIIHCMACPGVLCAARDSSGCR